MNLDDCIAKNKMELNIGHLTHKFVSFAIEAVKLDQQGKYLEALNFYRDAIFIMENIEQDNLSKTFIQLLTLKLQSYKKRVEMLQNFLLANNIQSLPF